MRAERQDMMGFESRCCVTDSTAPFISFKYCFAPFRAAWVHSFVLAARPQHMNALLDCTHTSISMSRSARCQYFCVLRTRVSRSGFRTPCTYTSRDLVCGSDFPSVHTRSSNRFPGAEQFELYEHGILCHTFCTFDGCRYSVLRQFSGSSFGNAHSAYASVCHTSG